MAASFSAVVACIDTCESGEYSSEYVLKTAALQFVDTALWSVIGEVILGKTLSKPLNAIGKKVVQTRLGGKALELAKSLGSATNKALDRAEQKLMEKTGGSWTKKVAQSKLGLGIKRVLADDTGSVEIGFGGSGGGLNSVDDIFTQGKKAFDNFDINSAYVKPKHLSTTRGNGQKFIGANKSEAESILKDVLLNGKITSITDNGLTKAGNASYEIVIDAGMTVGTKGETLVKIVISSDGGMLSAYPTK